MDRGIHPRNGLGGSTRPWGGTLRFDGYVPSLRHLLGARHRPSQRMDRNAWWGLSLRSMATTHELLSSRRWQGLPLTELVRRELAPYATRNNTEISGPGILLKPEAGQALAMVLHELATNAAKYGALSTKEGRVSIRWGRHVNGNPRSHLVLEWQEIGGPPVIAPGASSYGTSTIRDLIPTSWAAWST